MPAELYRFLKALCEFGKLDLKEHLAERLVRDVACDFGNFDECCGVTLQDLIEKYDSKTLYQKYKLPKKDC